MIGIASGDDVLRGGGTEMSVDRGEGNYTYQKERDQNWGGGK